MKSVSRFFIAAGLAAVVSAPAGAQIASTGLGGGATDPSWTIQWSCDPSAFNPCSANSGGEIAATVVTQTPSPPWAPNDASSRWIGAAANGTIANTTGDGERRVQYAFYTNVNGTGTITGQLGWDNYLLGYELFDVGNNSLGLFAPSASWINPVPNAPLEFGFCRNGDGVFPSSNYPNGCLSTVNIAYVAGAASIGFYVAGDGTTDGFRFTAVPEPASVLLLASGMLGLGLVARRRTSVTRD